MKLSVTNIQETDGEHEAKRDNNLFEWEDSLLCNAIEKGFWVYLKGCETANPAILERLNS